MGYFLEMRRRLSALRPKWKARSRKDVYLPLVPGIQSSESRSARLTGDGLAFLG
jgi:hypothetical protein